GNGKQLLLFDEKAEEVPPSGGPTTPTTDQPVGARSPDRANPPDNWKATYHLVDTPRKFQTFLRALKKQKRIAVDLETTSLEPRRAEIVGYAFSWQAGEGWYLPVRGPAGAALLDPDKTLEQLRPVLEDAGV